MAKRRFNKYAHRQYLASRARQAEEARLEAGEDSVDAAEPLRVELRDDMSDGSDAPPDLADTSDPLDATPDAWTLRARVSGGLYTNWPCNIYVAVVSSYVTLIRFGTTVVR